MVEYSHEKVSKMLSVTYELLNQQNRLGDGMSRFPNDFTREMNSRIITNKNNPNQKL